MKTGVVILAAGESARMGAPKQLMRFRDKTLLRHAVDAALGLDDVPVVVVTGAHEQSINGELRHAGVAAAHNSQWQAGMAGSLRVGLKAMMDAQTDVDVVIFMLCDQPLVTTDILRRLIDEHEASGAEIVASSYGDALGVPALFSRSFFGELLSLEGREGARRVIERHRAHAAGILFPDGAVDIDTPADFSRLTEPSTLCSA